ncbi:hypothetical protein EBN03_20895 [Nocardia stercoris]|uniref:Uncharacterized protein n=1 Tax=Nocardia stercoris TaxID=2483361 RepID=A0A3M2KZ31_9NOCA|nr:hypothetical protein EBN03_20895 [Nocardia stercoris]
MLLLGLGLGTAFRPAMSLATMEVRSEDAASAQGGQHHRVDVVVQVRCVDLDPVHDEPRRASCVAGTAPPRRPDRPRHARSPGPVSPRASALRGRRSRHAMRWPVPRRDRPHERKFDRGPGLIVGRPLAVNILERKQSRTRNMERHRTAAPKNPDPGSNYNFSPPED